jgi:twinkle protein
MVEHNYQGKSTETEYARDILKSLQKLCKSTGVTIILVAHPTKMQKDENGFFVVPNLYSISGSAHFFNAADIGITVYRRPGESFDMTEVHVQKVRFKWVGKSGMVEFKWDPGSGTYMEYNDYNVDYTSGDVTF